jgi:DNA-binding transcriptional MerR regulator
MRKPLSQIPMDFGGQEQEPSRTPDANASPGQREGQYLASAGVGVRVKAYKQPAETQELPVGEVLPTPVQQVQPPETADKSVAGTAIKTATETAVKTAIKTVAGTAAKTTVKTGASKRGRKSLKQVAAEADLIEIPADEILFGKQYYTMGEVSEMFKVNQSLLRYWETEFDVLQPRKNKKGDRYFRPIDIKNLHLIYHLLRQKKYTIEGAKEFLRNNKKAKERFEVIERLQQIRNFLLEWKAQL